MVKHTSQREVRTLRHYAFVKHTAVANFNKGVRTLRHIALVEHSAVTNVIKGGEDVIRHIALFKHIVLATVMKRKGYNTSQSPIQHTTVESGAKGDKDITLHHPDHKQNKTKTKQKNAAKRDKGMCMTLHCPVRTNFYNTRHKGCDNITSHRPAAKI